jgi:hypothetical protein
MIPYSKIVDFFTKSSGKELYSQIVNTPYADEFIKGLQDLNSNSSASAYIANGTNAPPQDLDPSGQMRLKELTDMPAPNQGNGSFTDLNDDYLALMQEKQELLAEQSAIQATYCQFLTALEVYRNPIIGVLANYDFVPTSSPACSSPESFQTRYSSTGEYFPAPYHQTSKSIWDDPLIVLYLTALLGIGLYMFYRIYKKHGYK